MKHPPRVFILLLLALSCAVAEDYYTEGARGRRYADWITYPLPESNHPIWQESTKPLRKDDAWLAWREQTRPTKGGPLWRRMLGAVALWTDSREIQSLPSSASLGERLNNYDVAIGIKFTIFF